MQFFKVLDSIPAQGMCDVAESSRQLFGLCLFKELYLKML